MKDRPLLLLGVLLIVVGLQMVFTGFVADMISRRRMEEKPAYRVSASIEPSARRPAAKRKKAPRIRKAAPKRKNKVARA